MVKFVPFSSYYILLKKYLDELTEYQSGGGSPPILYPEVNSKLEKITESKEKKI